MYPVLPFAIGAMVGAAAVRLLKTVSLQGRLDKAQERLREATISSLDAIEHSSAGLKAKLAAAPEAAAPETAAASAEAASAAAPARKAPARRRSTAAAGTAKTAAASTAKAAAAGAAKTAAPRTRKKATPPPPADTGDSA